jgi:hypothetical protein
VFQLFAPAFVCFLFWTSSFASGFFLATVNETSGGNREIDWPEDSLGEKLFTFLRVAWIFLLSAIPCGIMVFPLEPMFGWRVFGWSLIPTTIFLFPICLVSGLINGSTWQLWNGEFILSFLARPLVVVTLYSMSALLLFPCLVLGYLTIVEFEKFIFLAPLTGFVWSACLLIYGRLLGRVLWVVGGEQEEADQELRKRRKLKRLPTA